MAKRTVKKRKREPVIVRRKPKRSTTVTPRATTHQEDEPQTLRAARRSIESENEPVEQDVVPSAVSLPALPVATITWTGEGDSKWWNTLEFKNGEQTPIDSLPPTVQRQMIQDCAVRGSNWKVEYVIPEFEVEG